jgi:hypothetical protein
MEGAVEHLQDDAVLGRTSLPARMSSSAGASLVMAAGSVPTAETDQVGRRTDVI